MNKPIVIYEDNHLLTLIKPAGWLSQPDGRDRPDILAWAKEYVAQKYHKPGQVYLGLVHRLDFWAAGVLVLARTSKAAERLSREFRIRSPKKIYLALVEGRPHTDEGHLAMPLVRPGDFTRQARPDENGKESILNWRLVGTAPAPDRNGPQLSLLEVELITGFKHQIRAQLSLGLGCPIAGDSLYGAALARPLGEGLGLWARLLSVKHPTLPEIKTFAADPDPTSWPWRLYPWQGLAAPLAP